MDKNLTYKFFKSSNVSLGKISEGENEFYVVKGYVNTKGHPDEEGDIPTSINGKPVYDISRYMKNGVLLVDHQNSGEKIAGSCISAKEDEVGLFCEFKLMPLDSCFDPGVKHAVSAAMNGFLLGFSVCGKTERGVSSNPSIITGFKIFEISLVAIPCDEFSLRKSADTDQLGSQKSLDTGKITLALSIARRGK